MNQRTIYDEIENRLYEMITQRVKNSEYILDVGCGDCQLVNKLARETKSKVIGIDIHDFGFAKGRNEAKRLGVSDLVKCIKGDAQFLTSVFDEKFDVAISVYALHEYKKPVKILKEVNRALKPRGKIFIIDFIKGSTAERLWSERYYTPNQIKDLLKKSSFNDIETEFPEKKELVFIQGRKKSKQWVLDAVGLRA